MQTYMFDPNYRMTDDHNLEHIIDQAKCGWEITFRYKHWYCIIWRRKGEFWIAIDSGREDYKRQTVEEVINLPLFDGKTFVEALANNEIRRESF